MKALSLSALMLATVGVGLLGLMGSAQTRGAPGAISYVQAKASAENPEAVIAQAKQKMVGQVTTVSARRQQLVIDGKSIFEAQCIGRVSKSANGLIVLEAVTGEKVPVDHADASEHFINGHWEVSLNEIWIVEKGQARRLLSADVDGTSPLISDDGRRVAYVERVVDAEGTPRKRSLCIMDIDSGAKQRVTGIAERDDFSVVPLVWADAGRTLKVLYNWSETGGHRLILNVKVQ